MTKTANLTGPAKDPKSAETLKVSKKIELTKTVNKAKIVKEMTESELVNQTQAETKKTVSSKETKEVAKSKVVNSDSAKEFTKIVQTKEPESSEPVQTAKKAAAPELKKDTLPKEIAKPTIEAKKFEPVKITESVKKPEPVIEARTPDTKPAEPLAKNKLASVTPPISRQNSKLDLDSSDSESESEDDDGSDIPSSPEPTKRLIAVNTPSVTKTNHSQTSSQTSSFMELLEKKSVADSVAPVTNSIAGTGNILAELQEKPVEKDKPQPPKRIAGMQSLSALAKRAIPEVHDSTSSKIQSQKAKAVVKQPVVEVSSDESSSDDDSDDGSDDSDSDEDSDDDEPKVKIGGRKDSEKKKSKNRGFMGMIKSAKRV